MGEVPNWYRILKAAQYLGTTPWELELKPWSYTLQAEAAQEVEEYVRSQNQQNKPLGAETT